MTHAPVIPAVEYVRCCCSSSRSPQSPRDDGISRIVRSQGCSAGDLVSLNCTCLKNNVNTSMENILIIHSICLSGHFRDIFLDIFLYIFLDVFLDIFLDIFWIFLWIFLYNSGYVLDNYFIFSKVFLVRKFEYYQCYDWAS